MILLLKPITITEAKLAGTNLPEDPSIEWTAGETCALGAVRHLPGTHRVYLSLQDGNVNHDPLTSPPWWKDVGPTNRWAMFDGLPGKASEAPNVLTVTLRPGGAITAIGLVGSNAIKVRALMRDKPGGATVFDQEFSLSSVMITNALEYATAPFEYRSEFVIRDLPVYTQCEVQITLTGDGVTPVSIKELVIGPAYQFAAPALGLKLSIVDYSQIREDDFGVTAVVERPYVRKVECKFIVPRAEKNKTFAVLTSFRATPVLVVPSYEADDDALILLGILRDPVIEMTTRDYHVCTLTARGL